MLQKDAGGFIGHGVDPAAILRLDIKQGVTHDTIHVSHGIDMTLYTTVPKCFIRFFIINHSCAVKRNGVSVFPCNLIAVFGKGGCDYISQVFGSICKPFIGLFI